MLRALTFRKADTIPNNAQDGILGAVTSDTPVTKRLKGCQFDHVDSLLDEVYLTT